MDNEIGNFDALDTTEVALPTPGAQPKLPDDLKAMLDAAKSKVPAVPPSAE